MVGALVTLATLDYLDQAKAFFSSVYHNKAWDGECVLLAHDIKPSASELTWFAIRGIQIIHCKPLFEKITGGMHPSLTSKYYLFGPAFRKYELVVYIDADTLVMGNLNYLYDVKRFGAVQDYLDTFGNQFVTSIGAKARGVSVQKLSSIKKKLCQHIDSSAPVFNAGMFAFRPSKIDANAFSRIVEYTQKYECVTAFGDQLPFHLVFADWERLSPLYNMYVVDESNKYLVDPQSLKAIVLHFTGRVKPWNQINSYTNLWQSYSQKSSAAKFPCRIVQTWDRARISRETLKLKRRKVHIWLSSFIRVIDSKIGQVGVYINSISPSTYNSLRFIADQIFARR